MLPKVMDSRAVAEMLSRQARVVRRFQPQSDCRTTSTRGGVRAVDLVASPSTLHLFSPPSYRTNSSCYVLSVHTSRRFCPLIPTSCNSSDYTRLGRCSLDERYRRDRPYRALPRIQASHARRLAPVSPLDTKLPLRMCAPQEVKAETVQLKKDYSIRSRSGPTSIHSATGSSTCS